MNAFITLNYNDSKRTVELVRAIDAMNVFEKCIVVDNASSKEQQNILTEGLPNHVVLLKANENKGFAFGNNLGFKYLQNYKDIEFVCICNPDIVVKKEVIIKCINALQKDDTLGAISTRIKEFDGEIRDSFWNFRSIRELYSGFLLLSNKIFHKAAKKTASIESQDTMFRYSDCIRASFIIFRFEALQKAGFFDENTFLYYEEDILFTKFKIHNYKVGAILDEYYFHNHEIRKRKKVNISIIKSIYNSKYYYLVKYRNIGFFLKLLYKILAFISLMEYRMINLLRRV